MAPVLHTISQTNCKKSQKTRSINYALGDFMGFSVALSRSKQSTKHSALFSARMAFLRFRVSLKHEFLCYLPAPPSPSAKTRALRSRLALRAFSTSQIAVTDHANSQN